LDAEGKKLELERNAAVKKVSESMDGGFKFNTAISAVMVLMNAVDKYQVPAGHAGKQALLNKAIETAVLLLAPFVPHMAEELWQMMGKADKSVAFVAWPAFDEKALVTDTVKIAAQVNGKVRGEFEVPRDADEATLRPIVLADEGVQRHIAGKEIKKFIVIKNKLVSVVV
jgi:leucyl-tRNA synthetase